MARDTRSTDDADREGLDLLYHTARRIHRLAETNVDRAAGPPRGRLRSALRMMLDGERPADADSGPRKGANAAEAAVASVAERFAAGMIASFGGPRTVALMGRWVSYAARKRGEPPPK